MKYSKGKPKYSSANPKMEDCPINKDLSITINSAEAFPYLQSWLNHYMYMLKAYVSPYIDIVDLYPELSPSGRLHYHGRVRFNNYEQVVSWYFTHHKINGLNISLDTISDSKIWTKYILKQKKLLKPIMETYKLTEKNIMKFNTENPESTREQFKFKLVK